MARTPEGPASKKPLRGLTGNSNIEPHQYIDTAEDFDRWVEGYELATHLVVAAEGMQGITDNYSADDEDLSDVSELPEGTHQVFIPDDDSIDD